MLLFSLSTLVALGNAASNVTFFGAPRAWPLPDLDSSGHLIGQAKIASDVGQPQCGSGSGSANARSIAYYQGWNMRTRSCDRVWPSQINTAGLTHLILAFSSIDPKTFKMTLQNKNDEDIYRQFLQLKKNGLQTWLGVGGWEFTDVGVTRTTWSEMAASSENRKAFISSTVEFLDRYGFQGLDIDWEWPTAEGRGGRPEDKKNQVSLLKELREVLGTKYGLSCVLPQDSGYLGGIDVAALAPHVDWFNVLTYDLHGAWDRSIPGLGPQIRPHTVVQEIDEKLKPLWDFGVDSKKFVLGMAYYGRGYTVTDRNCAHVGCSFSGPSQQGNCSNQAGILSNTEIKRLIKQKGLQPEQLASGNDTMQVAWDDQWMGYDSPATIGKKKELASNRCMGGTAIWAIDYDSSDENGQLPPPPSEPSNQPQPSSVPSSVAPPAATSTTVASSQPPESTRISSSVPVSETPPFSSELTSSTKSGPPGSTASSSKVPSTQVPPPVSSSSPTVSTSKSISTIVSTSQLNTESEIPSTSAPVVSVPSSASVEPSKTISSDVPTPPPSLKPTTTVSWSLFPSETSVDDTPSSSEGFTSTLSSTFSSEHPTSSQEITSSAQSSSSQSSSGSSKASTQPISSTGSSTGITSTVGSSTVASEKSTTSRGSSSATSSSSSQSSSGSSKASTQPILSTSSSNGTTSTVRSSMSSSQSSSGVSKPSEQPKSSTQSVQSSSSSNATTATSGSSSTQSSVATSSSETKTPSTSGELSSQPQSSTSSSRAASSSESRPSSSGTKTPSTSGESSSQPQSSTSSSRAASSSESRPSSSTPSKTSSPTGSFDPTVPFPITPVIPTLTEAPWLPPFSLTDDPSSTAFPLLPEGGGLYQLLGWKTTPECKDNKKWGPLGYRLDKECCDGCWHDDVAKDGKTRLLRCTKKQPFGCGCGPLGLPIPPCDWPEIKWPDFKIEIDLPELDWLGECGILGCNPIDLFGCPGCKPGLFGLGGRCLIPGGCKLPCPPAACPPTAEYPNGTGWQVGPPPGDPKEPDPKKCRPQDRTTETEILVQCTEFATASSTSVISTTATSCITAISMENIGCNIPKGWKTTTTKRRTSTGSGSIAIPTLSMKTEAPSIAIPTLSMKPEAPSCSRIMLNLDADEGDNEQDDRNVTIPTLSMMPQDISIPTLSMKSDGPSCSRVPLNLDDDEGDNEPVGRKITIPTLSMKLDNVAIPTLSTKPGPTSTTSKEPEHTSVPEPPFNNLPLGGMWTINIDQMASPENKKWSIKWRLYDSSGNDAGSSDQLTIKSINRPADQSLPFSIKLDLTSQPFPESTQVKFEMDNYLPAGCVVSWKTGMVKGPFGPEKWICPMQGYGENSIGCDPVEKSQWTNKPGDPKFQRSFKCWFLYLGHGTRSDPWKWDI